MWCSKGAVQHMHQLVGSSSYTQLDCLVKICKDDGYIACMQRAKPSALACQCLQLPARPFIAHAHMSGPCPHAIVPLCFLRVAHSMHVACRSCSRRLVLLMLCLWHTRPHYTSCASHAASVRLPHSMLLHTIRLPCFMNTYKLPQPNRYRYCFVYCWHAVA